MSKPRRVVFLESFHGTESLFTSGLRSGAKAAGWETEMVFLTDASGRHRAVDELRLDLLKKRPDTVCFLMDAPLDLEDLWNSPELTGVDKISLWFDDFQRSPKTLAHPEIWRRWQQRDGVRVGIWDGYWRLRWKALTGSEAFPIHLAADPQRLCPGAEAWNSDWNDRAVFVGTIPSLRSLDAVAQSFPASLGRLLEDIREAMRGAAWPIRPYDIFQTYHSLLGGKQRLAIDALLKAPLLRALWNHLIWRLGKRIARLRGLAAIAEAGPIAILSGHGIESYAGEDELRAVLPRGADWVYADTASVPSSSWSHLFCTGKWQIQIIDPQSILGGLPFRIFECAACSVPLLSDYRLELAELFPEGSGLVTATDEQALQTESARLFASSQSDLQEQAARMHQCFLNGHTWEIRWRQIAQHCDPNSFLKPRSVPMMTLRD